MKRKIKQNSLEVDIGQVEFIIENCLDAEALLDKIDYDYEEFIGDKRNTLSAGMLVINIGEYAGKISEYIRLENKDFPWSDIIGMRNIFAHNYLGVNFVILWNTLNNDVPEIKEFFEDILKKLNETR